MKNFIKVMQPVFGLVTVGLLVWGGYELLVAVALLFKSVDPKLGAGTGRDRERFLTKKGSV
jgi:hypothetical protein